MTTDTEPVEPPITPEIRKWIEWYIQDLRKSAKYWLKKSNDFNPNDDLTKGARGECFGRYFALDQEATGLSFQLYSLDHPCKEGLEG